MCFAYSVFSLSFSPSSPLPSPRKNKSHRSLRTPIIAPTALYSIIGIRAPSPPPTPKASSFQRTGTVGYSALRRGPQQIAWHRRHSVNTDAGGELSDCGSTEPIHNSLSDLKVCHKSPKQKKRVLNLTAISTFQFYFKNLLCLEKTYKIHCAKFIQRNDLSPVWGKKTTFHKWKRWKKSFPPPHSTCRGRAPHGMEAACCAGV